MRRNSLKEALEAIDAVAVLRKEEGVVFFLVKSSVAPVLKVERLVGAGDGNLPQVNSLLESKFAAVDIGDDIFLFFDDKNNMGTKVDADKVAGFYGGVAGDRHGIDGAG